MRYASLFFVMVLAGIGCSQKKEKQPETDLSVAVSVISDITDTHALIPVANPLLQLYRFDQYPETEALFRLRSISDKLLTPVATCRLADGHHTQEQNTEDDPQFRKKNINAFYKRVRQLLNDFYVQTDTTVSLTNSECIRTICDELQYLATDSSTKKILTVFSDLKEKSDLFDVYAATEDPGVLIEQKLKEKGMMPERLDGITIFFVYAPADRKQDVQYRQLVQAYKKVMEARGGRVIIQATNDVFEL
jgi:hypothetical protein